MDGGQNQQQFAEHHHRVRVLFLIVGVVLLFALSFFGYLVLRAYSNLKTGTVDVAQYNTTTQFTESLATAAGTSLNVPRSIVETADDPSLGPVTAPVTIVEFGDFECPFCQHSVPILKDLEKKYGKKLHVIFRDFPNSSIHDHAEAAALAAGCVQDQNKFWQYHDLLYINQAHLEAADLAAYAAQVGADMNLYTSCVTNKEHLAEVQEDYQAGINLGVSGTPTWFVNGWRVEGALSYDTFVKLINLGLKKKL